MPGGRARTLLRLICAVVIVARARPAIAADTASAIHGLWVWKSSSVLRGAQDERMLRDFCRSADINEVYLSVSAKAGKSDEQEMGDLIALLHRSGIRVEALLTSVSADAGGQAREKLLDHVRAIARFNQQRASDRFDGIRLDIEPQQRAENKGQGNLQFLPGLVDAFWAVRALTDAARLTVDADIQSKLLKGDSKQRRALLSSLSPLVQLCGLIPLRIRLNLTPE